MTPLDWDATYEIVLELIERYPDLELETVGLEDLRRRIANLPGFEDEPDLANDAILREILRLWYEESGD